MELRTFTLQPNLTHLFPTFKCCAKPCFHQISHKKNHKEGFTLRIGRRKVGILAIMGSLILSECGIVRTESASAFDFGFVAPDQTVEEAESGVRGHAQDLLEVKGLLEKESWGEAQKALRLSSALLKKDMNTIIQSKPGSERPQLRELYFTLFNNVTRLDYAARAKDGPQVWQCYENIVGAVSDILTRI
ncbi:hypothetical protein RIF29_04607 [Crotalaria pallida]|uniref:PsbQ-like protein 3, chloroplastic n=1 Tax=Crotalaria pallida TaxID=3830 RepID=A0AAN9J256_CROPI